MDTPNRPPQNAKIKESPFPFDYDIPPITAQEPSSYLAVRRILQICNVEKQAKDLL